MYLPVVLYREYGIGGWIIFAVPNVIGAAAMAWLLRDARQASGLSAVTAPRCCFFTDHHCVSVLLSGLAARASTYVVCGTRRLCASS